MRVVLAAFVLVHGIAHLPGFVVPWRLAALSELPYKTTLLNGTLDVGEGGIRIVGLLWLFAGLGCAAAAVAIYLDDFRHQHSGTRVIMVLGMMKDKDREGFLDHLLPHVDEVIVTQARISRSATARELEASLRARGRTTRVVPDPADAISLARQMAASDDLILVTGSLMLVGETKAILLGCGLSPLRG